MEAVEELVHVRVPDRTIEVRVHGVSGTPPEALLGGFPVRVAGDADAGFYRVHDAGSAGGILEAFSWGGLTSRTRVTALWLLLAPLAMINVAGWMSPTHSARNATGLAEKTRAVAVRLVAVVATALVVTIAVQAAASVMGLMTADALAPGRAAGTIALAALVPPGLHVLTRLGGAPDDRDQHDDPWGRVKSLRSLALAHLGIALSGVAALGWAVTGGTWSADAPGILGAIMLAFAALGMVMGLSASLTIRARGKDVAKRAGDRAPWVGAVAVALAIASAGLADQASRAAAGLTQAHFVLAASAAILLAIAFFAESRMPVRASAGFSTAFAVVGFFMAMSAFGALSYALMGLASRRSFQSFIEDPQPAALFRLIDFAAVVMTCGVLFVAARIVGRMQPLAPGGEQGVDGARRFRAAIQHAPVELRRAGVGMLIAALALVATELTRRALPAEEWARRLSQSVSDPRMLLGAVGWLFVAYLVVRLCARRWALLAGTVAIGAAAVGLGWLLGQGGIDVLAWARLDTDLPGTAGIDHAWIAATTFTIIAVVAALFLPAVAVLWFILSASGDRESRRGVGVLWDLTNYWPRIHHPWAPPPYTETAIPALERRLAHVHEDHPDHAIVLSCHSQGAVLGFPVMRRVLASGEVPATHLRFLTYGNLLAEHYQRLFPHLFDDSRLGSLNHDSGDRWIQLFRETDPLGHPIGVLGAHSRQASHAPPRGVAHVLTHSNYTYSPEYQAALDELGGTRMPPGRDRGAAGQQEPDDGSAPHGWRRWWLRRRDGTTHR
ncbi:hypothetical protein [Demequina sp.]|uniref:hypothetical protein n=1 Tax=Demequina sp. TaxID=2050685 RepID=UPI003A895576